MPANFNRWIVAGLFLMTLGAGCAREEVDTAETQLQVREFQTRSYDTSNTKMIMKAMVNVLQDEGFIIKTASLELGVLTATKEMELEDRSNPWFAILWGRHHGRGGEPTWDKNAVVECSANVSEFGETSRVRVIFQEKKINNLGETSRVQQIKDPKYYQEFFAKVSKGVFIEKEGI